MNPDQGYLATHVIKPLAAILASRDNDAMLLHQRTTTRHFGEPPSLMPAHEAESLLQRWLSRFGDDIGVLAARRFDPQFSSSLQQLFLCSNSLREGLYYLEKFSSLLSEQMILQVMRHRSGLIRVRLATKHEIRSSAHRCRMELLISTIIDWCKQLCGNQFAIENIHLPWDNTGYHELYQHRWGAPVGFRAEQCVLEMKPQSLDLGVHNTNPNITMLLRKEVESHFRKLVRSGALADHITNAFASGVLSLSADQREVADHFHISPRTLNRYLQRDGTSLKQLVTEARIVIACDLLQNSQMGIDDIARRLGLSGRRALDRIFSRAEGESPARYRERHQQC